VHVFFMESKLGCILLYAAVKAQLRACRCSLQVHRLESSRAAAGATAEAASQALREAYQQRSAAAAAAEEAGSDSATAAVAAAMLRQQLARAQEERAELSRQVDQLQVRPQPPWWLALFDVQT
jgi:hypothetical protein